MISKLLHYLFRPSSSRTNTGTRTGASSGSGYLINIRVGPLLPFLPSLFGHTHNFVRTARLDKTTQCKYAVDVYECECGTRRVAPRGVFPEEKHTLSHDLRGFPHNCLIDASDLKESLYG